MSDLQTCGRCKRTVQWEAARLLSINRTDSLLPETGVHSYICIECSRKIMMSTEGWF